MPQEHTTSVARIPVVKWVGGSSGWAHSRRYEVIAEAIVDGDDAEYAGSFTWLLSRRPGRTKYAVRMTHGADSPNAHYMHADLWVRHNGPLPDGMTIDHKNRDGLDNRKENLRPATSAQQGYNKGVPAHSQTGYKGVHWASNVRRFKSFIRATTDAGRQRFYLGSYLIAEEAAVAYNRAASRLHGDFAQFNQIPDEAIDDIRSAEILAVVLGRLTRPVSAR